jgi:hypothetical protein
LFGVGASAHGQGIEWEVLTKEAVSLYQKGQYDRAMVVAKKALEVAEKAVGPNHPSVATSLNNLSVTNEALCIQTLLVDGNPYWSILVVYIFLLWIFERSYRTRRANRSSAWVLLFRTAAKTLRATAL